MKVATIIGYLGGQGKGECVEQKEWEVSPVRSGVIRSEVERHLADAFAFLREEADARRFDDVEQGLIPRVFALGRLLLAYYLAVRHERSEKDVGQWTRRGLRHRKPQRKQLGTYFGRVTFWRTYLRRPGGTGLHPLDLSLGLTSDGFSFLVMSLCARLSTLLTYEQVTALWLTFTRWSPSKTTIERAVLGFGRHTEAWFEAAPPPQDDGDILVVQVDSKATPTATDEELHKRRQKRKLRKPTLSPRHRAREKRSLRTKVRRKKGDKSKNGKAATIVTMYTLKKGRDDDGKAVLLGPINKRVYASYAPKRYAFEVARREADKRGF